MLDSSNNIFAAHSTAHQSNACNCILYDRKPQFSPQTASDEKFERTDEIAVTCILLLDDIYVYIDVLHTSTVQCIVWFNKEMSKAFSFMSYMNDVYMCYSVNFLFFIIFLKTRVDVFLWLQ